MNRKERLKVLISQKEGTTHFQGPQKEKERASLKRVVGVGCRPLIETNKKRKNGLYFELASWVLLGTFGIAAHED